MKKLFDIQKESMSHKRGKSVVFTFGSFNPITRSDAFIIEAVLEKAKQDKMDTFIFTERKQDAIDNPLSFEKKVGLMEQAYPNVYVNKNRAIRTVVESVAYLENNKYQHIHFIVPSDSAKNIPIMLEKFDISYTIQEFNGDEGDRDSIREAVFNRDVTLLEKHLPSRLREDADNIMKSLTNGYKIYLSESERTPLLDISIARGDIVQAKNSDILEVLAISGNHVICESVLTGTIDTHRISSVDKVPLRERLIQKDGEWALVSKTTGRVLRKYGKNKPSDDVVTQDEKEIQFFKHINK